MVEPSEDFPIAIAVLSLDPNKGDAIVGSKWVVFDSATGGAYV